MTFPCPSKTCGKNVLVHIRIWMQSLAPRLENFLIVEFLIQSFADFSSTATGMLELCCLHNTPELKSFKESFGSSMNNV